MWVCPKSLAIENENHKIPCNNIHFTNPNGFPRRHKLCSPTDSWIWGLFHVWGIRIDNVIFALRPFLCETTQSFDSQISCFNLLYQKLWKIKMKTSCGTSTLTVELHRPKHQLPYQSLIFSWKSPKKCKSAALFFGPPGGPENRPAKPATFTFPSYPKRRPQKQSRQTDPFLGSQTFPSNL